MCVYVYNNFTKLIITLSPPPPVTTPGPRRRWGWLCDGTLGFRPHPYVPRSRSRCPGPQYPDLISGSERILAIAQAEEETFTQTLKSGTSIFDLYNLLWQTKFVLGILLVEIALYPPLISLKLWIPLALRILAAIILRYPAAQ